MFALHTQAAKVRIKDSGQHSRPVHKIVHAEAERRMPVCFRMLKHPIDITRKY